MKIEKIKAKSVSYGARRSLSTVSYIVIHYTGNDGDTAQGNGKYFATGNTRSAGAHFFVSQNGDVVESIPMELIAWAVGGNYGGGQYYGKCTNNNSVSIELCDNASKAPSDKQTAAVRELVAYIRKSCRNASTIVRHWDINHKSCPGPYLLNDSNWNKFVKAIGGTAKGTQAGGEIVKRGQANANTFLSKHLPKPHQIDVDGYKGKDTKKQMVKCVQLALDLDNDAGLIIDGIVGPKTKAALESIKKGDKRYLCLAVKILYQCNGKDANLKYSKTFGGGLEKVAGKKKITPSDILALI